MKMAKDKKLEAFKDEFNGKPIFAIWEVDEEGNKVGSKPVVSMGKVKLQAMVEHIDQARRFLDEN